MPKSSSKSCVWCINMCTILKYFMTMVYDELFSKHLHLECDVFLKTIVLFVFSFDGFYFCFWQLVHSHFKPSKKLIFFGEDMSLDLTI